eukprot:9006603-Alexandrium_andersonii.AAC.1
MNNEPSMLTQFVLAPSLQNWQLSLILPQYALVESLNQAARAVRRPLPGRSASWRPRPRQ